VALVTGASAGIGKAIARRLLEDGWIVYGAARRVEQMADIRRIGAHVLGMDVTDDRSMREGVHALLAAEGRIDALVNNAGYGSYGAIEDVPIDEVRHQFEVNVFGAARLAQLVLPSMRKARFGTIVNISSVGGRIWMPFGGWYHATKHALEVLSDVLRVETRPFGVNVVVVQPGAIQTEWAGISADNLDRTSPGSAYHAAMAPMARALRNFGKAASPDVVAAVVSRALNDPRPRRRYAAPAHVHAVIFLHWLLPDSLFERLLKAALK
jgi:NAD(P)-dependent dehydrogenase (short-subunit alcohol dehydrogenase family)